jgi:hypothetical protein
VRRFFAAAAVLLALCGTARAQTAIVGDAWIEGRVLVGTTTAARMTVAASSTTSVPFQVSGVDLTPFLRVGADGTVGFSTYSAAHMDAAGSADDGAIGLELRSGNWYGSSGRTQIAFGAAGTTNERHAIDSVHLSSTAHNSLDFRVWTPDAGTTSIATMTVLSLVTVASVTTPSGSVHVRPYGDPEVELVVSDGGTTGGGTIHVANQVTPSSRALKTDISYLTEADRLQAYEDVKNLRHVSFRYKHAGDGFWARRRRPVHRGLLYEEAPASLRGPGDGLVMDQRLLESELALQELAKKLETLDKEVGP